MVLSLNVLNQIRKKKKVEKKPNNEQLLPNQLFKKNTCIFCMYLLFLFDFTENL